MNKRKQILIGLLLILLFPTSSEGKEYRLLEADRLDFEYSRLRPANRDPYVPEYTGLWRERAAVQFDLRLLEWGYWRNNIHTETIRPSGHVKTVGWQWEFGIELGKFDLFHQHHSRHVMEDSPENRFSTGGQFPVDDAYGVRIRLLK